MTPDKFAAAYGPTADDVRQVADHLIAHGLTVTSISHNRTLLDATGPVRAIEAAFGVTISDWHDPDLKRDFFGNDAQPSLPAAIAPLVVGVFGLNNHYSFHHAVVRPPSLSPRVPPGSGPAGGYTPSNLKTAYGVDSLATSGVTGSGQGIGLFELDGFNQANITKYDMQYGLILTPPAVQIVDGGPVPPLGQGQIEVELDIEVLHAFAPGAAITAFEAPNSDIGALDAFTAMVTANLGSNSTSWGSCEPQTSGAFMDSLHQTLQQAAAQGQSFFAASGDFGAFDCAGSPQPSTGLAVDNPANDPMMTGVGGTRLVLNANFTYSSESAWSNPSATPPRGTGGGLSEHFARPSWQAGPGVANSSSNGNRQVPDVALDADPATGYSVCVTTCWNSPTGQGWVVIGGTSPAAPSWAAFTALYNQYAAGGNLPKLGFANPTLYSLGSNPQLALPFHDVITGNNLNYNATVSWDYPTGWGTPQVSSLITDIVQQTASLWVRRAAGASAGGTPAAPPRQWFGAPAVQFPSTAGRSSIAPPSLAANSSSPAPRAGEERVGATWAARFMPDAIARLTGWLSSW